MRFRRGDDRARDGVAHNNSGVPCRCVCDSCKRGRCCVRPINRGPKVCDTCKWRDCRCHTDKSWQARVKRFFS